MQKINLCKGVFPLLFIFSFFCCCAIQAIGQNNERDVKGERQENAVNTNIDQPIPATATAVIPTPLPPKEEKEAPKGGQQIGIAIHQAEIGKRLAKRAEITALKNRTKTGKQRTGKCYKYVSAAVYQEMKVLLTGGSAYMAAEQLARSKRFKEVRVAEPENLKILPAGVIVVWGKTERSPHGHIAIASGDGREISDHIAPQRTHLRTYRNYRVFLITS
uniref:CHAP domain-containing protein n=1 Tax=candidate division CPR3 bacterium TaxID=2268181 RepID=A0A7C4R4R5_UNCC3